MKSISQLQKEVYAVNKGKGYHEEPNNIPTSLCLIHSEVTEALEAYIEGSSLSAMAKVEKDLLMNMSHQKFKEAFEIYIKGTVAEELSDIVIRTLDLAEELGINLESNIELKLMYNRLTPRKKF